MTAKGRRELEYIKSELNSIIRELDSISGGVRRSFRGIGNDLCANSIDKVISQCRRAQTKLNNLDTHTLTDSFKKMNGLDEG